MCLLRKITYGEFSEFVGEKKITYNPTTIVVAKKENIYKTIGTTLGGKNLLGFLSKHILLKDFLAVVYINIVGFCGKFLHIHLLEKIQNKILFHLDMKFGCQQ